MNGYPNAFGPYSIYRIEGNVLYLSGQLPVNPETGCLSNDFKEQCQQAFDNVNSILKEHHLNLNAIFKLTIYLSDISYFDQLNQIMISLFDKPYPARTVFQVGALPQEAFIEIEAMAKLS
ncbi:RidA family protein [Streptococcus hongkongensis]|nr:endoribonuclease L-PSP [Streptococcus uberis]